MLLLANVQREHMLRHTICVLLPDSEMPIHNVQHAAVQHCRYATGDRVTAAFQSCRMLLYRS